MGKGDIKSKRGKIANGSFGKKRKQRLVKATNAVAKTATKSKKVSTDVEAEVKKTKKTTKRTAKKTTEDKGEE